MLRRVALGLAALALCGCSPSLPKGVSAEHLDEGISGVIGDPNTCVLIGETATGKVLYRYNSHTACALSWPACDSAGTRTDDALLKLVAQDGKPRMLSCNSQSDASRGVGWAAGPVPGAKGKGLVYAAAMEGTRAFPGRMMAERLDDVFQDAGF